MEWISVKDRLPEDISLVLAFGENYHDAVFFAYSNKVDWFDPDIVHNSKIDKGDVTHWMPLPEPPKQ